MRKTIRNFFSKAMVPASLPKGSSGKKPRKEQRQKVLVIDNYDSFTYNLVQYVMQLGYGCSVFRCDEAKLWREKNHPERYSHLIISPGPGRPGNAGFSCNFIANWAGAVPILGVCLGHQCIGEVYGGKIIQAKRILHGKVSHIKHNGKALFHGEKNPLPVARYHSLIVAKKNFPKTLEITAEDEDGQVMALRHKKMALWGVQFHPESIATASGMDMLSRFLQRFGRKE